MAEVELVAENNFDPDPDHLKHIIRSNPDLKSRFREIIGDREIFHIYDLHDRGRVTPNGDVTIFYRYFFSKYISIRQGVDARSGMINKHASIFPFRTNPELPINPVAVAELFDDTFSSNIREFVDYHFGNAFVFEHLRDLFLTNIDHFKKQHFQHLPSRKQLTRIIGLGSNPWRQDIAPEFLSDYFTDFIRLNDDGAEWYKYFQTKFNVICDLYQKESLKLMPEKSNFYFKYLPEINCCELLLLLEVDYYQENRRRYTEIFRKYLFFFGHAIRRADPHPVAFIDETLFRCLQYKRRYETFQGPILELLWELWMMTLVHRRKHPLSGEDIRKPIEKPDEDNLKNVIMYADRLIPNIESAVVYYSESRYRRFKIFMVFDDVAFLINYSRHVKHTLNYGQILKSALIDRKINTIVLYNAYLGMESHVDVPQNKTDIRDFIREQTELHAPAPLYPEDFIIKDLEGHSYFERLPAIARP